VIPVGSRTAPARAVVAWRIAWTIVSLVAVQTLVCGVSAAPVVLIWSWLGTVTAPTPLERLALVSVAIAPSYALFAFDVMIISPLMVRLLRWHTPPDADMRIADMDWALLRWVRYAASIQLARVIAGTLVRGTPLWTSHLRLGGARLGRRVYVNSLSLSDYNLIECGDDVVIGAGVHLSGHTVEAGVVKTARVRLGDNVTIGLGSVIDIGVEIGSGAQVGALSFVPKYATLEGGVIYAGSPATPLESAARTRDRVPPASVDRRPT
jgi:acetyltransferase-like isoleucine patch superfamily enzyme